MSKTLPFIKIAADEHSQESEIKEEVTGTVLSWVDSLRIRIKETSRVLVSMVDRNECSSNIFSY